MKKKNYIDIDSLVSGKIYKLTNRNPCFINYKLVSGIYSNGNCLILERSDKDKKYSFIFLKIETKNYREFSANYIILKMLYDGKVGYAFIRDDEKDIAVYE